MILAFHRPTLLALAAGCALALAPTIAAASFPAGVWGLIDKVTPSPDVNNPTLRIDGLFIVAGQLPDFADYPGYGEPQAGYMYYQCPKGQEKVCMMEWADIAAAVGTEDNCRGWGDLELKDNGTVRDSEPMSNPDDYPIASGVFTGFSPCEALRKWALDNPGTTGEPTTSDGTDGSGTDPTTSGTSGDATTDDSGGTTGDGTGGTGGTSGTGGSGTGTGSTTDPGATSVASDASTGDGTTGSASASGDASSASASEGASTAAQEPKDSGCACRSGAGGGGIAGLWGLVLGLGLARGRRRRA